MVGRSPRDALSRIRGIGCGEQNAQHAPTTSSLLYMLQPAVLGITIPVCVRALCHAGAEYSSFARAPTPSQTHSAAHSLVMGAIHHLVQRRPASDTRERERQAKQMGISSFGT